MISEEEREIHFRKDPASEKQVARIPSVEIRIRRPTHRDIPNSHYVVQGACSFDEGRHVAGGLAMALHEFFVLTRGTEAFRCLGIGKGRGAAQISRLGPVKPLEQRRGRWEAGHCSAPGTISASPGDSRAIQSARFTWSSETSLGSGQ